MSNELPKMTARMQRFAQIVSGATHGNTEAALAYDIFHHAHTLAYTELKDQDALDMVRVDLSTKFVEVAAKRNEQDLNANPYFADISRLMRRKGSWEKAQNDVCNIVATLRDAADEFMVV